MPHPIRWRGPLLTLLALAGCRDRDAIEVTNLEAPAAVRPLALNLAAGPAGQLAASWLEPRDSGGYAFRIALRDSIQWGGPRTVIASAVLATHPTDLPGVAFTADGAIVAHWQEDADWTPMPYETDVRLAVSTDQGVTWSAPSRPYAQPTVGEHGFVSTWATASGVGMAWLDARRQAFVPPRPGSTEEGQWRGAMALQGAVISAAGKAEAETVLDSITCECCPTAAALTSRGPIVVYRDREVPADVERTGVRYEQSVIRDIAVTRYEEGRWTAPHLVHADGWAFNGCPNNGPAVAASGERVVVAWMTGVGGKTALFAAFSRDAGDSFGAPIRIDEGKAVGQVTVALTERGAMVGWLEESSVMARRLSPDGSRGPARTLGPSAGRTRLPRWSSDGDTVLAAWLEGNGSEPAAIRLARLQ
jgi:hypothetical protein